MNDKEIDLPSFISQSDSNPYIEFKSTEAVGTYAIVLYSTLSNSLNTQASTTFTVTVVDASGITVTVEPEFILNVQDQQVAVGSSLIYSLGYSTNTYGFEMTVKVNLGPAAKFTTFESETNSFKVHST